MNKLVHYDKEHKVYTITLLERGGPIISDESLERANEKFNEAFKLADAVRKVLQYLV